MKGKRSAYGAAIAELRQKVKDARTHARNVRKRVIELVALSKVRHREWSIAERARHRETMSNARKALALHTVKLRQAGRVEAHVLITNAIDALQAVRDEHLRDRLRRAQAHAGEFRESEAGIAYIVEGHPELLDIWKHARASIRERVKRSHARGLKLDPVEAWDEHLQENSSDISEAKARIHGKAMQDAELEIRDLTRQWKAGKLDPELGEACTHPRAVENVEGTARICPDCGQTFGAKKPTKKRATKKPASTAKLRHRAKVRKRDKGQTMNTARGMVYSLRAKNTRLRAALRATGLDTVKRQNVWKAVAEGNTDALRRLERIADDRFKPEITPRQRAAWDVLRKLAESARDAERVPF
jgi:hypothetical protein